MFNETSPLEYPKTFLVWANCTTPFVLSRNGTTIINNSEQIPEAGAYNFSFSRNDSTNYSIIFNQSQFIISPQDLISPTYSVNLTNNTIAGQITLFSINVSDNLALQSNGGYIFSTNNTGDWINDSFVLFTATPSWANVTKILNSTAGLRIGYRWFFNDSSGNTNSTPIYELTTLEETIVTNDDNDSPGGGSSITTNNPINIAVSFEQLEQGYVRIFKKNYQFKFNFSNQEKLIKINSIFQDKVNISFESENYLLSINESEKINLNNDNYYDLFVNVSSIFGNSANMFFKLINETINPEMHLPVSENVAELIIGNGTGSNEDKKRDNFIALFVKYKKSLIYIFSGFILLILIFIIIIKIAKLKRNQESSYTGYNESPKKDIFALLREYEESKKKFDREECLRIYEEIKKVYNTLPEKYKKIVYRKITGS